MLRLPLLTLCILFIIVSLLATNHCLGDTLSPLPSNTGSNLSVPRWSVIFMPKTDPPTAEMD